MDSYKIQIFSISQLFFPMFSPTSPMASPRRRVHAPRQQIPGVATAVAAGHGAVHPLLALAAWRWEFEVVILWDHAES